MTRHEIAAAIRSLPEDEKLELLGELCDSLDHGGPLTDSHKEVLDRRLNVTAPDRPDSWCGAHARIIAGEQRSPFDESYDLSDEEIRELHASTDEADRGDVVPIDQVLKPR